MDDHHTENEKPTSAGGERTAFLVRVTKADAARLQEAFSNGEFSAMGIVDMLQLPGDTPDVSQWVNKLLGRDGTTKSR